MIIFRFFNSPYCLSIFSLLMPYVANKANHEHCKNTECNVATKNLEDTC